MKPIGVIAACLLMVWSINADAKYHEPCSVLFETEFGWSTTYHVQCNYLTGAELNTVTSTFKYQSFSTYAVVFWAKDQATIIRMQGLVVCGIEASDRCASNGYAPIRGTDQEGRTWKVLLS